MSLASWIANIVGVAYVPPEERKWPADPTNFYLYQLLDVLIAPATDLINQARSEGIPVVMVNAYRTAEQQLALYRKGRTTPGAIVTDTLLSYHQYRRAFDLAILDANHQPSWDRSLEPYYHRVGLIGESIGWRWGGRFKLADLGHFEY